MKESLFNTLVEASSRLADVELFDEIDHDCIDEATVMLERISAILDSTRDLDLQKCSVPVEYKPDFFSYHMNDIKHLRNLSRAFRFASDVASFNREYKTVAQNGAIILDLANAVRRGGIVVDHLVAVAISACGVDCIRSVREHFADEVRRDLIASLVRNESEREPFSAIAERDARWKAESGCEDDSSVLSEDELIDPDSELSVEDQRTMIRLVNEFGNRPESEMQTIHANQEQHALAITRLLTVDLAMRCWNDRNGRFPNSIADLVPDVLSNVPSDPFTDDDFIYIPSGDSFTLYSAGPDKTDGGGKFGPWFAVSAGGYDLCLDSEDYWSECCTIPERPNLVGRLWARLRFWRRDAQYNCNANES